MPSIGTPIYSKPRPGGAGGGVISPGGSNTPGGGGGGNIGSAIDKFFGAYGSGSDHSNALTNWTPEQQAAQAKAGKKSKKVGGGGGGPAVPELVNTAQVDPRMQQAWDQYQQNLKSGPNERVEDLWGKYQEQLSTSNLDRLQDVTGSKIRDRYEGARGQLQENLARRGMLGSGVEQELQGNLSRSELADLSRSDAELALADQGRRDALILQGMPMATYDQQRVDRLMSLGMPYAQAIKQAGQEDRALGLRQWEGMLGADLAREQFGLQRDIAQQSAQMQQQQMLIGLLSSMMPLF